MEWIENGFFLAIGVCLFVVAFWCGILVLVGTVGMVSILIEDVKKVPSRSLWYRMGMLLGRLRRMIPHADEHGNPAGFTGR